MSDLENQIIDAVYKRRALWDPNDPLRKQTSLLTSLWKDIAEELGTPARIVKKKWQNLRIYYIERLRKKELADQGYLQLAEPEEVTKWHRFDKMNFLKDVLPPSSYQYHSSSKLKYENPSTKLIKCEQTFVSEPFGSSDLQEEEIDPFQNIENNEIPCTSTGDAILISNINNEDEDDLFFKSLLPSMRLIPPAQKLKVRTKIQNAVLDSVIASSNNSNLPVVPMCVYGDSSP